MEETYLNFLIKTIYLILLANFVIKISKWLINYYSKLKTVNKIKGLPMIPFIGNVHQLKSKYGKKFILNFFFTDLKTSKFFQNLT